MKARILKKMLPKPELPDRLIKDRLDTGQVVQLFRSDHTFWHQKTKTIFFVMKIESGARNSNNI
jgi:hypothetical protein